MLLAVRLAVLQAGVVGVCLLASASASANGRFPASNQIVFSPADPSVVVLRTTFGIFLSHDGGSTWRWLCEDVLGVPSASNEDPSLALTAQGSLVAGSSAGVYVSADNGCTFAVAGGGLKGQLVVDVALVPGNPHAVVALTSKETANAGADGGPGYAQQVFLTMDDGVDWAPLGVPVDPSALATTIDVGSSDASRLYVSASRNNGQLTSLFVSVDAGSTWIERPVPTDPTRESNVYIGAIDPGDPDRVYLRTAGSTSRLLVTTDAGQTFVSPLTLSGQMLGFALSSDGSTIYAGSAGQGLFVGTRDALSFENVSKTPIQCLAVQGAALWACSDEEQSGFIAGLSTNGGTAFAPQAHLVAQPLVACAEDAGATVVCGGDPRTTFCQQIPGCMDDAGTAAPDAGVAPTPSRSSCHCAAAGSETEPPWVLLAVASVFVAPWLRRRARPPALD